MYAKQVLIEYTDSNTLILDAQTKQVLHRLPPNSSILSIKIFCLSH